MMNVEFNAALIGTQDAKTACDKVQAQWEDVAAQGRPPRLTRRGQAGRHGEHSQSRRSPVARILDGHDATDC